MKILIKVQATSAKPKRGRPAKAAPPEGEEKFLELDISATTVIMGFPDDEKTKVAVERGELEKALKFITVA